MESRGIRGAQFGRASRAYLGFAALEVTLASLCAALLAVWFDYALSGVVLHFAYVLSLVGLQTGALGALAAVLTRISPRLTRHVVCLALGIGSACLLLLHAANLGSNLAWGAHIDGALLRRAPAHLAALAAAFRIPVFGIWLGLLAVPALVYAALLPFGSALVSDLCALVSTGRDRGLFGSPRRSATTLLWMGGLPAWLAGYSAVTFSPEAIGRAQTTVLAGLFVGFLVLCGALLTPLAASLARELRELRTPPHGPGRVRRLGRWIAAVAGICGTLAVSSVVIFAPEPMRDGHGEALSTLVFGNTSTRFRESPHLLRVRSLDARERRRYPAARVEGAPNVVLILVDDLRAASCPTYGYERATMPFLSELEDRGRLTQVELATSTCSESVCGIVSTLSSRRLNEITYGMFNLHDVLYDVGYQVRFILSGDHSWQELPALRGDSLHYLSDGYERRGYTLGDDRTVLAKLSEQPAYAGRPTFFYLHLMSAHPAGAKLDHGDLWENDHRRESWTRLRATASDHPPDTQSYDERVLQTDSVLERTFLTLDAKGYLGNAVVIVTSDHGEAFGEHGFEGHGDHLYQEHIRIPLWIYDTADSAYANTAFATQVDVAPTVLDRLGLPIPETWHGHSLMEPLTTRYTHHETYSRTVTRYAVIRYQEGEIHKLMKGPKDAAPRQIEERLFDLRRDPAESRNLVAERPELAATLRRELERYRTYGLGDGTHP